jgi:hypothetical protein
LLCAFMRCFAVVQAGLETLMRYARPIYWRCSNELFLKRGLTRHRPLALPGPTFVETQNEALHTGA